jgi:hypothetical protein
MKIEGKCHCGKISYEAEIDPERVVAARRSCGWLIQEPPRTTLLLQSPELHNWPILLPTHLGPTLLAIGNAGGANSGCWARP